MSRYTEVLTRLFLQAPPRARIVGLRALDVVRRVPAVRRAQLRRLAMLDLGYDRSPILEPGADPVGQRIPNVRLSSAEHECIRLYELLPYRPVLIDVGCECHSGFEPYVASVRVGAGGFHDDSRRLAQLVGGSGWLLVRPDAHVAAAGNEVSRDPEAVLRRTMGSADPSVLGVAGR